MNPVDPPAGAAVYTPAFRLALERSRPDAVAAVVPGMERIHAVTRPNINCGISAAWMALTLTGRERNDDMMVDRMDMFRPPGAAGWTVGNMARFLDNRRLARFPIYILGPALDDDGDAVFLLQPHTQPRADNWACVYIPAAPLRPAHWTFAQIAPVEAPVEEDNAPAGPVRVFPPCVLYTAVPCVPDAVEYWRCMLTQNNYTAYQRAKNMGRACTCDQNYICEHEMQFRADHPDTVAVSLYSDHYVADTMRAQVLPSPSVQLLPQCQAEVVVGKETQIVGKAHCCHAVLDIAAMINPWHLINMALFHRLKIGREEVHPYEEPLNRVDVRFGGLNLECIRYEPRFDVRFDLMIGSAVAMGICGTVSGIMKLYQAAREMWSLVPGVNVPSMPVPKRHKGLITYAYETAMEKIAAFDDKTDAWLTRVQAIEAPRISFPEVPETTGDKMYRILYESLTWAGPKIRGIANHCMSLAKCTVRAYGRQVLGFVGCVGLTVGSAYLLKSAATACLIRLRRSRRIPVVAVAAAPPYGYHADLQLEFPDDNEMEARLACIPNVSRDHAYDLLRRVSAEKNWAVRFTRQEILTWVERVLTTPGETVMEYDRPGKCLNCKTRPMTYRMLCKACWSRLRSSPYVDSVLTNTLISYVGVLAIRSSHFEFPYAGMKDTAMVRIKQGRGRPRVLFGKHTTAEQLKAWYVTKHVQVGYRGRSCGPVFMMEKPKCFPRGHETAVVAFIIRLGAIPQYEARPDKYLILYRLFDNLRWPRIQPEGRDEFLAHFRGKKLEKMLEAERTIEDGKYVPPDPAKPVCKMSGFTKAEKSFWTVFWFFFFVAKSVVKPRFICCPDPAFLYTLGPYTHAQTKSLAKEFGPRDHLFYAGCATPEQLNEWMNFTIQELGSGMFVSLADDISAIDSCHNEESMKFHTHVRRRQFNNLPEYIERHFLAEEHLRIRIGPYRLEVDYVNGSGVSDTSYKNSLLCLLIRLIAVAHAARDLSTMEEGEVVPFIEAVRKLIYSTASGDDGLTRCARHIFGTDMTSEAAKLRYCEAWSWFGFHVKLAVYTEAEWRLATFLANRPTWTGSMYEWTPEPARRLRSLFWQIDNSMHPVVWGRSVATGLDAVAAPNPVLGPIAKWYLRNTTGPVVKLDQHENPYSPFHNNYYTVGREVTERAIDEFLTDYGLMREDYDIFLRMLRATPSVYVNFECRLILNLFRTES